MTEYSLSVTPPVYRYFVTDLLTNIILAEIPFDNVSYQRAIKGAGAFSGNIPITEETNILELYVNTLPGKCALYVMRDTECVWGGIIWTRKYQLTTKLLEVNAAEFTSYFYHRHIWRTWSHTLGATITVSSGGGIALLENGNTFQFGVGSLVKLIFNEVSNFGYNGTYQISGAFGTAGFSFVAGDIPDGTYALTTVTVRSDTYDYIRSLVNAVFVDFTGIAFANDEIEPALGSDFLALTKASFGGVATITTASPHGAIVGQLVTVVNVGLEFNGQRVVSGIPTSTSLTFQTTGGTVGVTSVSPSAIIIINKELQGGLATLMSDGPHGLAVGDTVVISGVDDGGSTFEVLNGTYVVTTTPYADVFTYSALSVIDVPSSAVVAGLATRTPFITVGTYGAFPGNSDLGVDFAVVDNYTGVIAEEPTYSGVPAEPIVYRGFELKSVGEALDSYSDLLNGFEYRIDCAYNADTNAFTRTFVIIPINFPNPPIAGEVSPISRFGADKLIFTWPGNIIDIALEESAEDAATRFFMVGNIPDLGTDASQPYAAASNIDFLQRGWPLLDAEESDNNIFDEETLLKRAERYQHETQPPIANFTVTINGSLFPTVNTYDPGNWCSLVVNDPFILQRLASDLEPRDTVIVRKIDSIKVNVPSSPTFPETVDLTLVAEWQVDKVG